MKLMNPKYIFFKGVCTNNGDDDNIMMPKHEKI